MHMEFYGYIHGYLRKICGYGYGCDVKFHIHSKPVITQQSFAFYTVSQKRPTKLMPVPSSNINPFGKFFHY